MTSSSLPSSASQLGALQDEVQALRTQLARVTAERDRLLHDQRAGGAPIEKPSLGADAHVAARLERALAQGDLQLHYQPELDLVADRVFAYEALCRWNDAELGAVGPDTFIRVAEETGQIVRVGRMVLAQVLRDLSDLRHGPEAAELRVAINFSMQELSQPDFESWFIETVTNTPGQPFNHLEIEITESVFQRMDAEIRALLMRLQARGIRVAMDDFGTGYSSLARLHMLPFDKIKLDKQFVRTLNDPLVHEIVRALAQLAQKFGKVLVAEGVETQLDRDRLRDAGCTCVQGYLVARPAPLAQWVVAKPS